MSMSLSAIRSEFRSGSYYRDSQLVHVQRVSEYRMLSPKWTSLTPPSSQGTGSIKAEVAQSSPEPEVRTNQCLLDMTEPLPHECTQLWLPTQELHRASRSALQCRWERKVQGEDTGCWGLLWEAKPCWVARALMDAPHQCTYGQH